MLRIREKLKDYSEIYTQSPFVLCLTFLHAQRLNYDVNEDHLLFEDYQLYQLPTPSHADVKSIRELLREDRQHGEFQSNKLWLDALESSVWWGDDKEKPVENDLVVLSGEVDTSDSFTSFLRDKVIQHIYTAYTKWRLRESVQQSYVVSGDSIHAFTSGVTVMLASVIPTISIIVLYFIHNTLWRLAFITFWAAIFSSALRLFTKATQIEIFTASVAMAAVQVVFVGSASNQTVTVSS